MTAALLTYRPPNVRMLRDVLGYMRKEEAKRRFLGNTFCYMLKALVPRVDRESYSEFARRLDDREQSAKEDTRTGRQILDELKAKLLGKD